MLLNLNTIITIIIIIIVISLLKVVALWVFQAIWRREEELKLRIK